MRIALVSQRFLPYTGGVELHVAALARELALAGDDPLVLTAEKQPDASAFDIGVDAVRILSVQSWLEYARILAAYDPDVVHAHGARSPFTAIAALIANARRRPIVFTPHCFYPKWGLGSWVKKTAFDNILGKPLLRRATFTICLTQQDRADAMALGAPADRLRIVPAPSAMPVPPSGTADPAWRERHRLDRFLLFVGRLAPAKRVDFLIRGMRELQDLGIQLVLIGPDDGIRDELEKLASDLGVSSIIHFLGRLPRDELEAAYANCELFVLPSAFEGQPVVLLEAMAHGRTVLASDAGGNKQIVHHGQNGFLFPVTDLVRFCGLVRECLSRDLSDVQANARQTVLSHYAWPVVIPQIRAIYASAIRS